MRTALSAAAHAPAAATLSQRAAACMAAAAFATELPTAMAGAEKGSRWAFHEVDADASFMPGSFGRIISLSVVGVVSNLCSSTILRSKFPHCTELQVQISSKHGPSAMSTGGLPISLPFQVGQELGKEKACSVDRSWFWNLALPHQLCICVCGVTMQQCVSTLRNLGAYPYLTFLMP